MCLNPYNNKGGKRQGGYHTTSNSMSKAINIIYICTYVYLIIFRRFRFLVIKLLIRKIKDLKKILTSVNVSIPLFTQMY